MSASLVDIQPSDPSKRTWLIASSCAGAVGVGAVAVPFISSFEPSERAKAAGAAVEVDISGIKPGEKLTVEWRGKPVWILRRTPEQLATLPKTMPNWRIPSPSANPTNSLRYMPATKRAPSSRNILWPWAFAPTWVAPHLTSFNQDHSLHCRMTGRVVFSVLVTAQPLTSQAVFLRTSRRQTTLKCRPICTFPTANC